MSQAWMVSLRSASSPPSTGESRSNSGCDAVRYSVFDRSGRAAHQPVEVDELRPPLPRLGRGVAVPRVVGRRVGHRRLQPRVDGVGRRRVDRRADLVVLFADTDERHRGVPGDQLDLERLTLVQARLEDPVDDRVGGVGHRGHPRGDVFHVHRRVRGLTGRRLQQAGQAGDAHERPEQLLAVLGPVVGVGDPAARDRLGEGTAGAQRPRRRGHCFQR